MGRRTSRARRVAMLALALAVVGSGRVSADALEAQPMRDFDYPLEFHENGNVKIRLQAKTVAMGQDDKDRLDAQGVRLEIFDEEGNERGQLTAEDCVVDRKRKIIFSERGSIRLERDGLVLTGRGFRFYMDQQRLEILNDVRVEVTGEPEGLDALKPAAQAERTEPR